MPKQDVQIFEDVLKSSIVLGVIDKRFDALLSALSPGQLASCLHKRVNLNKIIIAGHTYCYWIFYYGRTNLLNKLQEKLENTKKNPLLNNPNYFYVAAENNHKDTFNWFLTHYLRPYNKKQRPQVFTTLVKKDNYCLIRRALAKSCISMLIHIFETTEHNTSEGFFDEMLLEDYFLREAMKSNDEDVVLFFLGEIRKAHGDKAVIARVIGDDYRYFCIAIGNQWFRSAYAIIRTIDECHIPEKKKNLHQALLLSFQSKASMPFPIFRHLAKDDFDLFKGCYYLFDEIYAADKVNELKGQLLGSKHYSIFYILLAAMEEENVAFYLAELRKVLNLSLNNVLDDESNCQLFCKFLVIILQAKEYDFFLFLWAQLVNKHERNHRYTLLILEGGRLPSLASQLQCPKIVEQFMMTPELTIIEKYNMLLLWMKSIPNKFDMDGLLNHLGTLNFTKKQKIGFLKGAFQIDPFVKNATIADVKELVQYARKLCVTDEEEVFLWKELFTHKKSNRFFMLAFKQKEIALLKLFLKALKESYRNRVKDLAIKLEVVFTACLRERPYVYDKYQYFILGESLELIGTSHQYLMGALVLKLSSDAKMVEKQVDVYVMQGCLPDFFIKSNYMILFLYDHFKEAYKKVKKHFYRNGALQKVLVNPVFLENLKLLTVKMCLTIVDSIHPLDVLKKYYNKSKTVSAVKNVIESEPFWTKMILFYFPEQHHGIIREYSLAQKIRWFSRRFRDFYTHHIHSYSERSLRLFWASHVGSKLMCRELQDGMTEEELLNFATIQLNPIEGEALTVACRFGSVYFVKFFLSKIGDNSDYYTNKRVLSLFFAVSCSGNIDLFRWVWNKIEKYLQPLIDFSILQCAWRNALTSECLLIAQQVESLIVERYQIDGLRKSLDSLSNLIYMMQKPEKMFSYLHKLAKKCYGNDKNRLRMFYAKLLRFDEIKFKFYVLRQDLFQCHINALQELFNKMIDKEDKALMMTYKHNHTRFMFFSKNHQQQIPQETAKMSPQDAIKTLLIENGELTEEVIEQEEQPKIFEPPSTS